MSDSQPTPDSEVQPSEQEWSYCIDSPEFMAPYRFITAVVSIMAGMLTLFLIVLYVRANCELCRDLKSASCKMYSIGLLLFISSFLYFAGNAIMFLTLCDLQHTTLWGFALHGSTQIFMLNYFLLIAMLFSRLVLIFKGSPNQISQRSIVMFWSVYVSTILCGMLAAFLRSIYVPAALTSVAIFCTVILMFTLMVVLVVAFMRKLVAVHKLEKGLQNDFDEADDALKKMITKSSLLAFISLSLSMFSFLSGAVYPFIHNVHFSFFSWLILCCDVSSNAVCIFLGFSHFTAYYHLLCAKCDRAWLRCATSKVTVANTSSNLENIPSNSLATAPGSVAAATATGKGSAEMTVVSASGSGSSKNSK